MGLFRRGRETDQPRSFAQELILRQEATRLALIEAMTVSAPQPTEADMARQYKIYRGLGGVKLPDLEKLVQDDSPETA